MKTSTMILAAAVLTSLAVPAQGQSADNTPGAPSASKARLTACDIHRFEQNYVSCMNSANDGVVESAIARSVDMRWTFPAAQLDDMRETLGVLATHGKTASIRYRASLAGLVFDAPSLFRFELAQKYPLDEDLFTAVSLQAQKALLGHNADRP
jgi:hypothetical protein